MASFYQFPNKTGTYVGKVLDQKQHKVLMEVSHVLKHPKQGDLHNPGKTEVPLFHERKALAEREKVWVLESVIREVRDPDIDYSLSLKKAWEELYDEMKNRGDEYGKKAIENLKELKKEYAFD